MSSFFGALPEITSALHAEAVEFRIRLSGWLKPIVRRYKSKGRHRGKGYNWAGYGSLGWHQISKRGYAWVANGAQ